MLDRPYKCSLCHSAFRTESGMKWHLAQRHDIPAALGAIRKDYERKLVSLQEENAMLKQRLQHLQRLEGELTLVKLEAAALPGLREENALLKQKLQQVEGEQVALKQKFSEAMERWRKHSDEMQQLHKVQNKEVIAMAVKALEDTAKQLFGTRK
ncbi:MAG: hypothetical protein ABSA18_05285 [Dehalococcoidia bacterium]